MKLKHWAGYGNVEATRQEKLILAADIDGTRIIKQIIRVRGMHECGLERNDVYDATNWLLKRFDRKVENYRCVSEFKTDTHFVKNAATNTWDEECDYTFIYTTKEDK